MKRKTRCKPKGFWTPERCKEDAAKYKTLKEWTNANKSAVNASQRNGSYSAATFHMNIQRQRPVLTKEQVLASARMHRKPTLWRKADSRAYSTAHREGYLDQATAHMDGDWCRPSGYWTYERLKYHAIKYDSKKEWKESHSTSYHAAANNKELFAELTSHMSELRKTWDEAALKNEAAKFVDYTKWTEENATAYQAAKRLGIHEEVTAHMKRRVLPNDHWDYSKVKNSAEKFQTRSEWQKSGESGAYEAARKNDWLDEVCTHMDFNLPSDENLIYFWIANENYMEKFVLAKAGISSIRLGDQRIKEVARNLGKALGESIEPKVVFMLKKDSTKEIRLIEKDILSIGTSVDLPYFNGCTEFRLYTAQEIKNIADMYDDT